MKTSRLWKLLRTFSKKEVKDLKKFVASPFFNQREDVVFLFEELIDCIQVKKITPTKEYIAAVVYPNEKFDAAQIHLISSILYKVIEQYMTYCELHYHEVKTKISLAAAYRKRRLEDHFQRTIEEAQSLQKKESTQNAEYYEMKYQILLEQYDFVHATQRMESYQLQEISDNLDLTFIIKRLQHSCLLLSHQAVVKQDYQLGLLRKTMDYVENHESVRVPAVMMYYYCNKILLDKNEEDFLIFKAILSDNSDIFTEKEARDLYFSAINFSVKNLNEGKSEYAKIGLDLHREMMQKKLLLENNIISRFAYRNIVSMGIFIKEYDWVEEFIQEYTPHLEIAYKESMSSLSLGRLHYERGELGKAMMLLQKADYTDLLLNLAAKTILMKIYCESDEFDLLSSHLAAMKAFIHRHKNTLGYHSQNYSNIINYTKKLSEVNFNDKKAVEKLKEDINQEKILTERKWMLRMLEKM